MTIQTQNEVRTANKCTTSLVKKKTKLTLILDGNPYWEWIVNYAAEDFQASVDENKCEFSYDF